MVLLLASLTFAAPECDDLKRDMMALELFLKDKETNSITYLINLDPLIIEK